MINNRILHLINAPEDIRVLDIENIKKMIEDYPYIQSFRALYLIALNKFDSDKYQSELAITAAYTTDKKKLYQLLNPIHNTSITDLENIKNEVNEDDLLKNIEIENVFRDNIDIIKDESEENSESIFTEEVKIDISEEEKSELDSENISQNIDEHSIESYKDEELTNWNPMNIHISTSDVLIDQIANREGDIEILKEQNDDKYNVLEDENNIETKFPIKTTSKSVENIQDNSSNVSLFINTWTDWLHKQKPKNPQIEKKEAIIDKFIENNPKISTIKENTDYVVKDKGENISHLMTETLAVLYLEQKIYTKAIEAFKILQEKYPEKSKDFKRKIKYIKDLQSGKIQPKDL